MKLCLKITAGLLLLVQVFHLASLQDSTDSPGRTLSKAWLREVVKNAAGSQNAAVREEKTEYGQRADETPMDSSIDYSSGIASGFMAANPEEEDNVKDKDANEESDDLTVVPTTVPPRVPHGTTKQPELLNATVSPTNATTDPTNSSQINITEAEKDINNSTMTPQNSTTHLSAQNSTTHLSAQNSTSFSDYSNHTTTLAPEGNATQESTTKPVEDTWLSNATESTNTTTVKTTMMPEINQTSSTSSTETTETNPETTPTAAPNMTEKASGGSSERGVESDSRRGKRKGAWGAVLGTAVAVACVGLVAYIILKKKHQKGFSHRKLVEEYPSDPVLRLDNSEPLDLNFGGSAYYNPGLQGDNIQMNNLPRRH